MSPRKHTLEFTKQFLSLRKQRERQSSIDTLPPAYFSPLSLSEQKIHTLSLSQLVSECKLGVITPSEILLAYGKKTITAHTSTNCITDVMFEEAIYIPSVAESSHIRGADISFNDSTSDFPLLGVPVSIKGSLEFSPKICFTQIDP